MKVSPAKILQARLAADMSRADLAHAIRKATGNQLKASERGVRGWERDEYAPSASAIAAIAQATGQPLEFFYADGDERGAADGDPFHGLDGQPPAGRAVGDGVGKARRMKAA